MYKEYIDEAVEMKGENVYDVRFMQQRQEYLNSLNIFLTRNENEERSEREKKSHTKKKHEQYDSSSMFSHFELHCTGYGNIVNVSTFVCTRYELCFFFISRSLIIQLDATQSIQSAKETKTTIEWSKGTVKMNTA